MPIYLIKLWDSEMNEIIVPFDRNRKPVDVVKRKFNLFRWVRLMTFKIFSI
jgi:hypothetical protein